MINPKPSNKPKDSFRDSETWSLFLQSVYKFWGSKKIRESIQGYAFGTQFRGPGPNSKEGPIGVWGVTILGVAYTIGLFILWKTL